MEENPGPLLRSLTDAVPGSRGRDAVADEAFPTVMDGSDADNVVDESYDSLKGIPKRIASSVGRSYEIVSPSALIVASQTSGED